MVDPGTGARCRVSLKEEQRGGEDERDHLEKQGQGRDDSPPPRRALRYSFHLWRVDSLVFQDPGVWFPDPSIWVFSKKNAEGVQ